MHRIYLERLRNLTVDFLKNGMEDWEVRFYCYIIPLIYEKTGILSLTQIM